MRKELNFSGGVRPSKGARKCTSVIRLSVKGLPMLQPIANIVSIGSREHWVWTLQTLRDVFGHLLRKKKVDLIYQRNALDWGCQYHVVGKLHISHQDLDLICKDSMKEKRKKALANSY